MISATRGMQFCLQIRPPGPSYHTRCTAAGGCSPFRTPWKRAALSHPRHNGAQDVIDAGGIALPIFPEPVVNVAVEASSHQHFGSAAELRQLLVRQWLVSEPRGSGRQKTADDRGDRFQLLGGRVRLHAEVLERGRAEQVERIRWGEDDGARKRFVHRWVYTAGVQDAKMEILVGSRQVNNRSRERDAEGTSL